MQTQIKQRIREQLVQQAVGKCEKSITDTGHVPSEKTEQLCNCTANRLIDNMSADDLKELPALLNGEISPKLGDKIATATLSCMKDIGRAAIEGKNKE